jgi:hypothetical protein
MLYSEQGPDHSKILRVGRRDTRRKEGRKKEFKSFLLAFLALLAPASLAVVLADARTAASLAPHHLPHSLAA